MSGIVEQLARRHNLKERSSVFLKECNADFEEEQDVSTHPLQIQWKQLNDLPEQSDSYSNVLPAFGFNIAITEINLLASYIPTILVNELLIELRVIKKANQFVSSKFGVIQLIRIMHHVCGATSCDFVLKDFKTEEPK